MRVVLFLSLAAVLLASVAFATPSLVERPAYDPEDIHKRGLEIYESFMDWKRSLPSDSDGSFQAFQRSLKQRELSDDLDGSDTPLTENEQSESSVEEQISEPDPPKIVQTRNADTSAMGEDVKLFLSSLLLTQLSSPNDACGRTSCKKIKASNPSAPSGKYVIIPSSKNPVEVYCEMGLNGGGYTFLSPMALSKLTRFDLAEMFTDRSTFLMRIRRTDGTQPYAVLSQLSQYSRIPLKLGLSENTGYKAPMNINNLGLPFLYFGFLPAVNGSNLDVQGLLMNGNPVTFRNCNRDPNNHITIFPDFSESVPSTYKAGGPLFGPIFSYVRPNPSGRVMPAEYFMFAESHWGGCGCYVQTNQVPGVLGLSIGFK